MSKAISNENQPSSPDVRWQLYSARFLTWPSTPLFRVEEKPDMVVCIPAYAEPLLHETISSLEACIMPAAKVAVFILFNADDRMNEAEHRDHRESIQNCEEWIAKHDTGKLQYATASLRAPANLKWGVGWARKVLMDEAAILLSDEDVILCLDSDCTVRQDYLTVVHDFFNNHSTCQAASIYFEHLLANLEPNHRRAIVEYELHLRYLESAKQWTTHPFSGYTLGSSMAVRRKAYLQQGGMNTRMAGEDFYFLQKFMEVGGWCQINSTAVYPSARQSKRVPFGTGRAMHNSMDSDQPLKTIAFASYRLIRPLFLQIQTIRKLGLTQQCEGIYSALLNECSLDKRLVNYLEQIDFSSHVISIAKQTQTEAAFARRFFRFFNSFAMIRYLHTMRDQYFADENMLDACRQLVEANAWELTSVQDTESCLVYFREKDKTAVRECETSQ